MDFVNRTIETTKYKDFLDNPQKRACRILGIAGIGKETFVSEMLREYAKLDQQEIHKIELYTECTSKDILRDLCDGLDCQHLKSNLTQLKLDKKYQHVKRHHNELLSDLFTAFDSCPQAIVFYNIDSIYDELSDKFKCSDIYHLLYILLNRPTYSNYKNRIYFVSKVEFSFKADNQRDIRVAFEKLTEIIKLEEMEAPAIRAIMINHCNNYSDNDLRYATVAQGLKELGNTNLNKLFQGHPEIAEICIEPMVKFGLDQILQDKNLKRKYFDKQEKVRYILEVICFNLEQESDKILKNILEYLVLLHAQFDLDVVQALVLAIDCEIKDYHYSDIFKALQSKFLISPEQAGYSVSQLRYSVPQLIKEAVEFNIAEDDKLRMHEQLGDIFVQQGQKMSENSYRYYRSAYYHYEKCNNNYKLRTLVAEIPGKFLDSANKCYQEARENKNGDRNNQRTINLWQKAYNEYRLVYDLGFDQQFVGEFEDKNHIHNFLNCCIELFKLFKRIRRDCPISRQDIYQIGQKAIDCHPDGLIIITTYGNFLFFTREYDLARKLIEPFPKKDRPLNNLYAKILFYGNHNPEKAQKILKQQIEEKYPKKPEDFGEKDIKQLENDCMVYYGFFNHHQVFTETIQSLILDIENLQKAYHFYFPYDSTQIINNLKVSEAVAEKIQSNYDTMLQQQSNDRQGEEANNNFQARQSNGLELNLSDWLQKNSSISTTLNQKLSEMIDSIELCQKIFEECSEPILKREKYNPTNPRFLYTLNNVLIYEDCLKQVKLMIQLLIVQNWLRETKNNLKKEKELKELQDLIETMKEMIAATNPNFPFDPEVYLNKCRTFMDDLAKKYLITEQILPYDQPYTVLAGTEKEAIYDKDDKGNSKLGKDRTKNRIFCSIDLKLRQKNQAQDGEESQVQDYTKQYAQLVKKVKDLYSVFNSSSHKLKSQTRNEAINYIMETFRLIATLIQFSLL
ncbi:MAG: hypothetical protein AB4041_19480 [Microcystaceae cyanobacterium]